MSTGETVWKERFTQLVAEAREASEPERAGRVGALNQLVSLLPAQVDAERSVALLLGVLEDPRLEGFEDEGGLSPQLAATRVWVSLGGVGSLTVPPERLEALRRWERRPRSVSWWPLATLLLVAFGVQVGFITLNAPGIRPLPGLSVAALAGAPEPERTWTQQVSRLCEQGAEDVFLGQLMANAAALLVTPWLVVRPWGRRWVRRGFRGVGLVGLAVAAVQGGVGMAAAWGTLCSAGASLLAAWWLRPR